MRKVTVVMCRHVGDDDTQDVFVFDGELDTVDAENRATDLIAADFAAARNESGDLTTAREAVDHVTEMVDFETKITALRAI